MTRSFSVAGYEVLEQGLARLAAEGGPVFSLVGLVDDDETWLDTADQRILGAGLVLRVREHDPVPTARLTPLGIRRALPDENDGFVQHLDDGPPESSVRNAGPVGTRVSSLAGKRVLEGWVTLRTRRGLFELVDGGPRVELRLDEMHATRTGGGGERVIGRLTFAEAGAAGAAGARMNAMAELLREPCGLNEAPDFAETAFELAGIEAPPTPDVGQDELGPDPSSAELAFHTLRRDARDFLGSEPRVRLGDDPEAVHDMRVAARRLRAALALFGDGLPKRVEGLARELRRIGRILGPVRDLEVQLEQVATWRHDATRAAAFDAIEGLLRDKRETARRRLLGVLDGARYERFTCRLTAFLRAGPRRRPAAGRRHARTDAPERIGKRYRAVRKVGDELTPESPPEAFHELRIRCKRLRYALEFHEALYDGAVATTIDKLSELQQLLGEHQDAWVASVHLEELGSMSRYRLPPQAVFLMGSIAAHCQRRAASSRRAFAKHYRKVRGRTRRALKRALKQRASSP